jgi:hypothetical protein
MAPSEFSSLRNNGNLTSPALAESALETAKAWGDFSLFMEYVIDPKREKYARREMNRHEEAEANFADTQVQIAKTI